MSAWSFIQEKLVVLAFGFAVGTGVATEGWTLPVVTALVVASVFVVVVAWLQADILRTRKSHIDLLASELEVSRDELRKPRGES